MKEDETGVLIDVRVKTKSQGYTTLSLICEEDSPTVIVVTDPSGGHIHMNYSDFKSALNILEMQESL